MTTILRGLPLPGCAAVALYQPRGTLVFLLLTNSLLVFLAGAETAAGGMNDPGTPSPSPALPEIQVFSFEEHLGDAILSESATPASDKESTLQVWPSLDATNSPRTDTGILAREAAILKFTSEGKGSVIFPEGLGIYTPTADSLVLRLRVAGPSSLKIGWRNRLFAWEEMEEIQNCDFTFPVTADNETHTYVIRLDNMDAWRQYRTVDGLRLMTEEAATIEIEGMEVHQRQGLFAAKGIGTREYAIEGQTRQVVYMHTPARLACRVTLPDKPVFATGLAPVLEGDPVQFAVTLTRDGQKSILLDKTNGETTAWSEHHVDLSAHAGAEVELELSATSATPGQIALWSTPVVYAAVQKDIVRPRPNIIVYLVDALRADHLNPYGYAAPTSPNLARVAEKGILFENCFSQETCTKPSVMTLHTGVDLIAHGYTCNEGTTFNTDPRFYPTSLREKGYATCAISQNSYGPPVSFTQKAFCRLVELHEVDRSVTEDTFQAAAAFFEEHQDRPFYMYIHTMECHEQWTLPIEGQDIAASGPPEQDQTDPGNAALAKLYDSSIVFADSNFGRIRAKLEELGLLENTLILFTADHGYALGERGEWEHGKAPYLDQIHIPLILSWPSGPFPAGSIAENVQIADISATILNLAGLPNPEISQGRSLLPLMRGAKQEYLERPIFSSDGWNTSASVIRGQLKLHKDRDGNEFLYDLSNDTPEAKDTAADRPDLTAELHQELKEHIRRNSKISETIRNTSDSKKEIAVDPVKLEILKSLGYISD